MNKIVQSQIKKMSTSFVRYMAGLLVLFLTISPLQSVLASAADLGSDKNCTHSVMEKDAPMQMAAEHHAMQGEMDCKAHCASSACANCNFVALTNTVGSLPPESIADTHGDSGIYRSISVFGLFKPPKV